MATSSYVMAQALLGVDDLVGWINERRAEGKSYEAIAQQMNRSTEGKVAVSLYTVRRWAENKESVA